MQRVNSSEKTQIMGKIEGRRRRGRGWDGWMASTTQLWVWANSGRQWRSGKRGMLQSMAMQRSDMIYWLNNNNIQPLCNFLFLWGEGEVAQLCPTLCNPTDCSLPGSSIHGIFQARTLEWFAISFSKAWKWKVKSESEVAQVVYLKVTQSCPTPSDPMDCSLPGSSIHGIFQARILEWVAISFSRGSSQPRDRTRGLLHCRQMLYHLSHQGSLLFLYFISFYCLTHSTWDTSSCFPLTNK